VGRKALALVTLAFAAGLLAGLNAPRGLADQIMELAKELVQRVYTEDPFELALRILLNNARVVALLAILSPLVVAPALVVFANGFILGVALEYAAGRASWWAAIAAVAPHGVLEIPALLYAAAACTSFGVALWRKILGRRGTPWRKLLALLLKPLAISLLLLAAAAIIEAFVTPALLKLIVGARPLPA